MKSQQYSNASDVYTLVTKCNPPYEMIFNAQINRAICFDMGSGNADQIRKQLTKMIKDDKNIDYRDQIYYAIGNLYQKENKIDMALEMTKKFTTPFTIALGTVFSYTFWGFLFSLIISAFIRKKTNSYDAAMAEIEKENKEENK